MVDNPKQLIDIKIIQDFQVDVDFELLTLVIKNLIDNGIKYSQDKHIRVLVNHQQLTLVNKGEALKEPLENYYKPFHTSKNGLGLGLYIVKSILEIHQMELTYAHKDGENIFTIV
jgi:two-component system OmpR family sensor kinase